jgi:hypothetical protein
MRKTSAAEINLFGIGSLPTHILDYDRVFSCAANWALHDCFVTSCDSASAHAVALNVEVPGYSEFKKNAARKV